MNTKNNRRKQDTDERIVRAVYQAMVEGKKPLSKVTVREVCQLAGINRSTFYAHYLDVYDVLEQVEKTMSAGLTESFLEGIDQGADIGECFLRLFRFIRDNKGFYRFYLSETGSTGVIGLAWDTVRSRCGTLEPKILGLPSQREVEYHAAFFLYGLTAMIRSWLEDDCPETPEEMGEILNHQYNMDRSPFTWGVGDPFSVP